MNGMSPAHQAVELGDVKALYDLLKSGSDIHEEDHGLTLLHHAIDVEVDSHIQSGQPLHVDVTALLLAMGADPRRRSGGGTGITAEHYAFTQGHWLASCLIDSWIQDHPA